METFAELVLATDSIAVVGNGPSELGKGRGPEIDSFDLVLRINGCSLAPEYVPDYGKKIDIWATWFGPHHKPPASSIRLICGTGNAHGTKIWEGIFGPLPGPVEFIPVQHLRVLNIKSIPTSGIRMLRWIFSIRGKPFPRKNCFGFSHYRETGVKHYYPNIMENLVNNPDFEESEFLRLTL